MNQKKACVHIFSYPLGISESIIQSVQGFAENGFDVDIYIDECSFHRSPIEFSNGHINIIKVGLEDITDIDLSALFSEQCPELIKFMDINEHFPRYPFFLKNMIRQARGTGYDCIIGIELFGLISARLLAFLDPAPLIYYNLELFQRGHCRHKEEFVLKQMEVEASRNCRLVIVPDKKRGEVLLKENRIRKSGIRFLPVSTRGKMITKRQDFFRKKFNISRERKILVYAGHFADWALCRELVRSSRSWPDAYVLVMHTWQKDIRDSRYFARLKADARENVYFSVEPISRKKFPLALSSADAGLTFYNQADENNTQTGSSSNQLTQYLKAGLPVIASDSKSIRDIFDFYQCGRCLASPFDIAPMLETFFAESGKYRKGVCRAYHEHYNFDVHFTPLLNEIDGLFS